MFICFSNSFKCQYLDGNGNITDESHVRLPKTHQNYQLSVASIVLPNSDKTTCFQTNWKNNFVFRRVIYGFVQDLHPFSLLQKHVDRLYNLLEDVLSEERGRTNPTSVWKYAQAISFYQKKIWAKGEHWNKVFSWAKIWKHFWEDDYVPDEGSNLCSKSWTS